MTDDTIAIVASNLTAAYYSAFERKPRAEHKPGETFGQAEGRRAVERDEIVQTYGKFKGLLDDLVKRI